MALTGIVWDLSMWGVIWDYGGIIGGKGGGCVYLASYGHKMHYLNFLRTFLPFISPSSPITTNYLPFPLSILPLPPMTILISPISLISMQHTPMTIYVTVAMYLW